ncbi:MAG TPA: ABC transporter permease [Dehalococcoidia bacterium]|jgi:peptide/nickel transport system permease protein|nr:ABC transporter permease [Dehalococcoidia bacterium]
MRNYVLHRLVLFLPTGIGVSLFIFGMLHVIPGDYAIALLMGRDRTGISTEEDFERVREKLGLNGSLPEQYLRWAGDFFTGDFGTSWSSNKLVIDRLAPRVVLSAELGVMAVVLACL